jgi:tetratricopeptide (TPR) repeat protein
MVARMFRLLPLAAALAGCATSTPAPPVAELPWQDAQFAWRADRVAETPDDIFRLDPQLAQVLADPALQAMSPLARARRLVTIIFGPKRDAFGYESGHSTSAAESWRRHRGDCISLTVLAYSAARALGLQAEIQEIHIPALYVRQGGFEYVNHHVNLHIRIPASPQEAGQEMIVDFDPDGMPWVSGETLSEAAVVARMYSNFAAEALAAGDDRRAYAYLKAAIATDHSHAASYTNLAVLYRRDGLPTQAEQLLRDAIGLNVQPETALHVLHELLQAQGRTAEAAQVAQQLSAHQDVDPYYWLDRGAHELAQGQPDDAVRALKRAEALSDGFGEVHRLLVAAYLQLGERDRAREQLALLAAAERGNPAIAKLKRKLQLQQ